jgi:hypothetical protein
MKTKAILMMVLGFLAFGFGLVQAAPDLPPVLLSPARGHTIESASSGSTSLTVNSVNYAVAANTDTSQRTGAMAIAGQTFTVTQTGVQPCPTPGTPSNLAPSNGATGVSKSPTLSWTACSNTDVYDVYFGTSSSPPFVLNTPNTSWAYPYVLEAGATYYWKIVAKNNCGKSTSGPVWSFTTGGVPCLVPGTPFSPSPSNGATGASTSLTLSWAATSNTDSYDVYLGTSSNPPYVGNTTSTSYSPSGVTYSTLYYWKVVAKKNCGTSTSGAVWSFTTGAAAPRMGWNPTTLSFNATAGGSNPTPSTLSIWNAGGGTLNWTASKTQSWLTLSPTSGSSTGTGNPNQTTVSVNISGLSAGTYNDTITISAPGASNTPQTVTVTLTLTGANPPNPAGPPKISVSPTSVSFGNVNLGITSEKTVTIQNKGYSDLVINSINIAGANASDFSQTNNCTTIPKGNSCTVTATFAPASVGKKSGMISISSNDPKKPTVNVKLSGNAKSSGCSYSISPSSQQFDASGGTGTVNVTAPSGCGWTAKSNANWITITSGGSGSGNGSVTYAVAANTGTSQRTGTMTIAGKTFNVTQSGPGAGPTLYAPHNVRYTLTGSSLAIQWDVSLNATGYKVGLGTESRAYDKFYDVGHHTTFGPLDISGFLPATYYLAVTAYTQSSVSPYSNKIAVKVVAGTLSISPTNVVGGATGTYTSKTSGSTANFSVTPFVSDGSVTASISLGQDVLSIRTDSTMAAITWKGVTIDGFGALTQTEEQALQSLAQSGLAEALAMIPLDASCGAVELDPAAAQALLLPWQIVLKYSSCHSASDARAMGEKSACSYFNNLDTTKMPKYIFMSKNDPIPYVFGSAPFDEIGAASKDPTRCPKMSSSLGFTSLFAQDQTSLETAQGIIVDPSPCGSECRWACGEDCEPRNCGDPKYVLGCDDKNTNMILYKEYTCWVNNGCKGHDICYDECNRIFNCTSSLYPWDPEFDFGNFICHHGPQGCDWGACLNIYEDYKCLLWKFGLGGDLGPKAYQQKFTHVVDSVYGPCTPPPPITFSISAVIAGTGSGTISANPPGYTYPAGTVVKLTESPASGSCFKGWGGSGGSGESCFDFGTNPTCTLTMEGDKIVWANFDTCTTCTYTYSAWSACQPNNTKTRTVISSSPPGCVGTPVLSQSCTYVPPTCTYSISPTSKTFDSTGGTGNVTVTAPNGCPWTATSNRNWITITSNSSGSGTGSVTYVVTAFILTTQRIGKITVYGDSQFTGTLNVTQSGPGPCPTPGKPSTPSPSNGATRVSTSPTLSWAATSNTDSYDVYFGTSSNPPYVGNTTNTSYPRSGLSNSTTYHWKIVAKNNCDKSTSGSVWAFTTAAGGGGECAASPPCCSTNNGIQVVGVIVKDSDCDCPPETTYAGMDNITPGGPWKICMCNGC